MPILSFGNASRSVAKPTVNVGECRQSLEALASIADVDVVAVRCDDRTAEALNGSSRANREHVARSWYREGPQQQRIGNAEHRRVRTDADGQRQNGDDGEAGILPHHAQGIPKVRSDRFEWVEGPPLPVRFLRSHHASEAAGGRIGGLSGVHACSDVVLGLHLQMEADLSVQLALQTLAQKQRPDPRSQHGSPAHAISFASASGSGPRKRSMVAAILCQSPVSLASCFRPAVVSE